MVPVDMAVVQPAGGAARAGLAAGMGRLVRTNEALYQRRGTLAHLLRLLLHLERSLMHQSAVHCTL